MPASGHLARNNENQDTMIQSIQIRTYVAATLACLLAASCSDLTDNDSLPDGGTYPMIFTAAVDAPTATRATVDNSWEGTEKVAVMVGGEVKKYKAAGNGALTPDGAGNSHYWSSTQPMTVQAWYSSAYYETRPTNFTVQSNQKDGTGYQQSDMLYAIQSAAYNPQGSVSLTFKHLPAKVVVNLKQGDGVTKEEVENSTVTLINQALTSGTININESSQTCTVAQVANGTAKITPQSTTSATNDYQKAVQALLVPQKIKDKPFIKVTINRNAATRDYYYTPTSDTEVDLNAGKQYTYNITVKETGLVVTFSESDAWGNGGSTDVTSKELADGYSASDLKTGDYYYSDGSTSDGGYRKYTNNTTATLDIRPVLTNPKDGKERSVIGIVFWVGDITGEDPLLTKDFSGCTHGLVMALQDASTSNSLWSTEYEDITDNWLNPQGSGNPYIITTLKTEDKMQGYANTKALKGYNTSSRVTSENPNRKVLPVGIIADYDTTHPAPTNSSDWYWPSFMELKYMCWGQNNSSGVAGRDMLNTQLGKLGITSLQSGTYWSSTERANYWAWNVSFSHGGVDDFRKFNRCYGVRAILAF